MWLLCESTRLNLIYLLSMSSTCSLCFVSGSQSAQCMLEFLFKAEARFQMMTIFNQKFHSICHYFRVLFHIKCYSDICVQYAQGKGAKELFESLHRQFPCELANRWLAGQNPCCKNRGKETKLLKRFRV